MRPDQERRLDAVLSGKGQPPESPRRSLYCVTAVRQPKRAMHIHRLEGGTLSGGFYEVSIDRGPPLPALSIQLNLLDLRRLHADLGREIERAATLGG
jgi:hypothetical protein